LTTQSPPKFACIGHPTDVDQFRGFVNTLRIGYNLSRKSYNSRLLIKLFEWTPAFKVKDISNVGFNSSGSANGIVVMAPFLPEMRDIKLKEIGDKIEDAIAIAAKEGCTVAALGGFTSIILQGREQDLEKKHGIKLTSGNTLTAAVIIRSVEQIAARFGLDLAKSSVAIIGASGDIGSGCTGYLCDKVGKLLLSARGMDKLAEVAEKYKEHARCEIKLFSDKENKKTVSMADIVICVTSAYKEILELSDFRPRTIVCDASAPLNVKVNGSLRPDVFIYHGGIVSLPFEIDSGFDIGLASTRTLYACQVEGILIAVNPKLPCSWGRGNISREKVGLFLDAMDSIGAMGPVFTIGNKEYSFKKTEEYVLRWKEKY
jgi:fatty aldehyde-generating acyl-ACP reductase